MASVLKVPWKEAGKILHPDGWKLNVTEVEKMTGISRATLYRYRKRNFESAPFWAVCKVMKAIGMTDEDRLKLIRIYSGEKK